MALTPQRRLTNALTDPLLKPLLDRHYATVHAQSLRALAHRCDTSTPRGRDLASHTRALANTLTRPAPATGLTTLVLNQRQRDILQAALGDDPRGHDATALVAMLKTPD